MMKPVNFLEKSQDEIVSFKNFIPLILKSLPFLVLGLALVIDFFNLNSQINSLENKKALNKDEIVTLESSLQGSKSMISSKDIEKFKSFAKEKLEENDNLLRAIEALASASNDNIFIRDLSYSPGQLRLVGNTIDPSYIDLWLSQAGPYLRLEEINNEQAYYSFTLTGDFHED